MPVNDSISLRVRTAGANRAKNELLSLRKVAVGLGVTFGALALGRAFASSITLLKDFQFTMARVRGISGATQEEFAALESTARSLGATTIFSAKQAAEGMVFLSQAGFTASETIQATESSLRLAQAGALGLAEAADITAKTIRIFGLRASEAGRIADVFAKAAASSNTNVSQLAQAMSFVGPVAKSLGVELESTAALIGVLGDAGIQATRAGTSLRQIFLGLLNPTSKAADSLRSVGISLDDVRDALSDPVRLFQVLKPALIEAEVAAGTFSRRAIAAALSTGRMTERLTSLTEELRNSEGFAQELADIMGNTLFGAFRSIQSAAQELVLSLGQDSGFAGALQTTALAIAGILNAQNSPALLQKFIEINKISETMANTIKTLSTAVDALQAVIIGLSARYVILRASTIALSVASAGLSITLAGVGATIRRSGLLLALSAGAFFLLKWLNVNKEVNESGAIDETTQDLKELAQQSQTTVRTVTEEIRNLAYELELLRESGTASQLLSGEISTDNAEKLLGVYQRTSSVLKENQSALIGLNSAFKENSFSVSEAEAQAEQLRTQYEGLVQEISDINHQFVVQEGLLRAGQITYEKYRKNILETEIIQGELNDRIRETATEYQKTTQAIARESERQKQAIEAILNIAKEVVRTLEEISNRFKQRDQLEAESDRLREQIAEVSGLRSEEAGREGGGDRSALATYDTRILDLQNELARNQARLISDFNDAQLGFEAFKDVAGFVERLFGFLGNITGSGSGQRRFQSGGIVPGAGGQAVPVLAHAGEAIFNPKQLNNLNTLLSQQSGRVNIQLVNESGRPLQAQNAGTRQRGDGGIDVRLILREMVNGEISSGSFDSAMSRRYDLQRV